MALRTITAAQRCDALENIRIDFYLAVNIEGIPVLNDMAGGITVTLEDDFSSADPAMTPGATLTLRGKQAEYYVRSRMNVGPGTNEARMKRQENYLRQLASQMMDKQREDSAFLSRVYDALSPYMTTDLSQGRLINELALARDFEIEEPIQIAGEHKIGEDGFMQFLADEESLQQAVLKLFYEPMK